MSTKHKRELTPTIRASPHSIERGGGGLEWGGGLSGAAMAIHHRDIAAKESEGVAGAASVAAVSVVLLRCCGGVAAAPVCLPHAIHLLGEEQLQRPLHDAAVSSCNWETCKPASRETANLQQVTCNLATCDAADPDKQTLRASCSCPELSTWTPGVKGSGKVKRMRNTWPKHH